MDLFKEQGPIDFYNSLKIFNVDYILIDKAFIFGNNFIGRNYPIYFVKNCQILGNQGKLIIKTSSKRFLLLKIV